MSENLEKSKQKLKKALERLENAVENNIKLLAEARKNTSGMGANQTDGVNVPEQEEEIDIQTLSISLQDLKKSMNN